MPDALVALLRPEEVLDLVLHYVQSKDIQLVEWNILLHRRMNVPRIVSVTRLPLPFCPPQGPPSQAEHTFVESFFSCSRRRFRRACSLLEHLGLSPQTASKLSLETEGDMRAKGHFYRLKQSATTPVLDQHLVLYPLSFAAFRPCEISEQPAQYSNLRRCSRILVPRPSAVYASLMRMMLRYPTNSTTWSVLWVDVGQLVLYHLLGYTLETISDEEDENRRIDGTVETIREWGMRKEWGRGRVDGGRAVSPCLW